ncbi:MAG: tetratricopeptide repeat protein, partial [Candidatus Methylomirabilia bacterium]
TALLAMTLSYAEREEEAIRLFERAMRLNPFPPNWYLNGLGWTYVWAERYEDAIPMFQKVLQRNPDFLPGHEGLATTYSLLGREGEARAEAAEVRRLNPNFSVAHWAKTLPHKNRAELELVLDAQRKAGLPE